MRSLEHIYVPAFDPDDRTDTVQVWCRNIEDLKTEYELSDREILNLTRKNLRGRAAEWARRNYSSLTSWTELKTGLIETFADEARYYDDLTQFMEYASEQAGSLAEYATRKWELAKKAIGVEMTEQRLVEAVISVPDRYLQYDVLLGQNLFVPGIQVTFSKNFVKLAINSTFSKSTGHTPFQFLMGCDQSPPAISALLNDVERLHLDACREEAKLRMDELAQTKKANYDKTKAKIVPFKVGDTVLIRKI
ncbi:hypothetical protein HF086_009226 [Spodoptera exigua]|uniref:Retrotransposon gag domain-containing protein n=1 Tax=Spodoptera exigua TaxID=7107 RepID=A0A922MRZ7_SPOEX|nr:hypothetical protein HF086_009226 [Spodoptera exigua]